MAQYIDYLRVLLLSGDEQDAELLKETLTRHVFLTHVRHIAEALPLLDKERYDVFLCDCHFQGGDWRDGLKAAQERSPELPTVVLCRAGGEQEWIEVLKAGAFDLLSAPFSEHAVLAVLEHAAASRHGHLYTSVA